MHIESGRLPIMVGLIACCAFSTSEPARADVITTFDLAGEIGSPPPQLTPYFPFTGSITIDTTLGTVIAQTLVQGSPTIYQAYDPDALSYYVYIALPDPFPPDPSCLGCNYSPAEYTIYFNTSSLVGYAGGPLGSYATPTPGGEASTFGSGGVGALLLTATATPETVPEPGSMALLTAGVAAALGAAIRRKPLVGR